MAVMRWLTASTAGVLGIVCSLGIVLAQDATRVPAGAGAPATTAVAAADARADAARLPQRVVLTWRDDPSRTQAVTWRTEVRVDEAFAELVDASANPSLGALARRSPARTTPVQVGDRTVYYHEARFTLLRPGTLYAYRVGDGAVWSEWFHFRTAEAGPAPFEFIYFGDAQNDIRSLWSRALRSAVLGAPDARFILHTGDMVNIGESDDEWRDWFGAGGWVTGTIPQVPIAGNHEYARLDREAPRELSKFWRPQFALPEDGPEGLAETVYSFDYQGVRVIVLNSQRTDLLAAQAEWLEERLRTNRNQWTVVAFHHPVFSLARTRDNPEIRDAWKPLFDKYRVDLVLQGHDHLYGRGQNIGAGAQRTEDAGTIYVISVGGPTMYEIGPGRDWATRTGQNLQMYQVIRVNGGLLRYEARTVTGQLFDAFELVKDDNGVRRFVDRKPDVPATQ